LGHFFTMQLNFKKHFKCSNNIFSFAFMRSDMRYRQHISITNTILHICGKFCLLSFVFCLFVFCLLSFVFCFLSFVFCLLSIVFCVLSFVFCLLSFVFCLLSLSFVFCISFFFAVCILSSSCVFVLPLAPVLCQT